jgi:hypothetical protein
MGAQLLKHSAGEGLRSICLPPLILFCSMSFFAGSGFSKDEAKNGGKSAGSFPELRLPHLSEKPKVDGVLDDAVWQTPPLPLGDWLTYDPVYGQHIVQSTQVWAAYDQTGVYFAFRCIDPEPDKIKTAISRRDTIFNDDWIGLSLDSLGNHQSSYELFVNADGIQADQLNSSTAGEDLSPDWVWESAAKKTRDGYTVEMKIPFKSIRFVSGAEVRMAVLFMRGHGNYLNTQRSLFFKPSYLFRF